jgi:hypothetical protein
MPRIWTERFEKSRHIVPLPYQNELQARLRSPSFVPNNVLMVNVAAFTFHFVSLQQVRDCLAYFEQKTRPSSRWPKTQGTDYWDHWEVQRWFEQLPMYLLEEPRRNRVVKALRRALEITDEKSFVSCPSS